MSPGGPIDRCYVAPGVPAWDCCEQLTVHVGGPAIGDTAPLLPPLQPGHRVQQTGTVNLVTVTATVLRPSPVPTQYEGGLEAPDVSDLEEAARATCGDVWTIWQHLKTLKRNGTLFAPDTREMYFDPAVSLTTQGGCSGWGMQFRVQLDGFRTA